MKIRSLIGILFYCVVLAAPAQSATDFAKANQEYATGNFKEAITAYQRLVDSGETTSNIFYNLGNAYFHSGDFGRAILNYERALILDPHHPEAQANLRIARDEGRALELTPGRFQRLVSATGTNQYAVLAVAGFWIGLFCLAGWISSRRRSGGVVAFSILSFCICGLAIAAIILLQTGPTGRGFAVVIAKEVTARLATADNAQSVLALPPGSEIKIISKRGDWVYAELPNDLRGWIPAQTSESVRL